MCRQLDQTVHGGTILVGWPTVLVGGPAFQLPGNIQVKGPASYQNQVIRDLFVLSTTPSGRDLLKRLGDSNQTVEIVPEADPHNSFCSPNSSILAKVRSPTGSTVSYNPGVAIKVYDRAGNPVDEPPQVVLGHELVHALDNAEGNHSYGTDSNPPASEPTIPEEEARAIGTGSHTADSPTENTIRNDLGLPARDNHYGTNAPTPTGNMRPGGY